MDIDGMRVDKIKNPTYVYGHGSDLYFLVLIFLLFLEFFKPLSYLQQFLFLRVLLVLLRFYD